MTTDSFEFRRGGVPKVVLTERAFVMGLLTSDEQGSLSSLNHSIYSEAQTPARSLALTGAYEAR